MLSNVGEAVPNVNAKHELGGKGRCIAVNELTRLEREPRRLRYCERVFVGVDIVDPADCPAAGGGQWKDIVEKSETGVALVHVLLALVWVSHLDKTNCSHAHQPDS